ncbi:MAG: hypothetical protein HY858_04295 [Candidatus Solibacter usitatus]|nr:hypothetical protein [Candidatus Solibacter usitatus]
MGADDFEGGIEGGGVEAFHVRKLGLEEPPLEGEVSFEGVLDMGDAAGALGDDFGGLELGLEGLGE